MHVARGEIPDRIVHGEDTPAVQHEFTLCRHSGSRGGARCLSSRPASGAEASRLPRKPPLRS
jgi:hypothetical protein